MWLHILHVAWRLVLYAVYGFLALIVFQFVFTLDSPWPGYIALFIVTLGVLKDVFDMLEHHPFLTRLSYKFVDHNPFNIVLLWGLLTGTFAIASTNLQYLVMALAGFDLVFDGAVDFKKEPSPWVMAALILLVGSAVALIHMAVGLPTAAATTAEYADAALDLSQNMTATDGATD